jgi:hypothetical protein
MPSVPCDTDGTPTTKDTKMTGIKKAVDLAGGANQLAHKLDVTHQAVYVWLRKGWVPAQRALEIEKLFDIPRAELFKPELSALFASN